MREIIPALALVALSIAACGSPQRSTTLLREGVEAPDFMALDQAGRVRQLSLIARRRPVVLFFYPRDGTPGCTREACAFRDAWDRLQASGAIVVGVSTDDVRSHQRFADEHDLPFPLLSDPDGDIMRMYGVPSALGMAARVTFVIGGDGRIDRVFPDVDPAIHVDEVLAALGASP